MHTIQKATSKDARLLTDLGAKTFLETHENKVPATDLESYVLKNFDLNSVESDLNNHENIFHFIYINSQIAGYSKINFNAPYPSIPSVNVTKLERLYLLNEFHGLKLGLTLLEFIIDLSKKQNQEGLWLFVWIENKHAISFYQKSGFEIIGKADFKISETHSNQTTLCILNIN